MGGGAINPVWRVVDSFNCDIEDQMGTSMACPHVASMAVLLRQYFRAQPPSRIH